MKKKMVVGLVLAFMVLSTFGAFAAGETKSTTYPWMASYDNPGQLNLYASVGLYVPGIDLNFGPELMLVKFTPGGVPLELGVTVRGLIGFSTLGGYGSWIDWAIAPMASLHWGVDFGGMAKFSTWIGLGLGISGTSGTYQPFTGVAFAFAFSSGVAWHFSNNLALIIDEASTGYMSTWGVGLKWAL